MTALPTVISPGDPGHILHHETIHALLNPVDAPFVVSSAADGTIGALPAAGQVGRLYTDQWDRLLADVGDHWLNAATGRRWVDVTDPLYNAPDDGVADASVAFQAAVDAAGAASNGVVFAPRPTTAYRFDNEVLIPSNVIVLLMGGTYVSDVATEFSFFINENARTTDFITDRDENIYVIGVALTTLRRELDMDGTEAPQAQDGGVHFKAVDGCGVWNLRVEGGLCGVQFWGCTDINGSDVTSYRCGDKCLVAAWPEAAGSCIRSNLGHFTAIETGKQLLSGNDIPLLAGSSFIITQDDVEIASITHIDGANAGNILETGGEDGRGVRNVRIGRVVGIVNTAGHKANAVLANYDGLDIGKLVLVMNADGECNIRSEGETDGSQVQKYLNIDSIVAWDRSGSAVNDLTAFKILCDTEHVHIGSVAAYGMRALFVHHSGAINPKNISIDSIFCEGANGDGAYIARCEGVSIGRIRAYNCGQNTGLSNALRSGVIADTVSGFLRIDEIVSIDTGAATQQYGLYSEGSVVLASRAQLGGVSGQFTSGGSGTLVADFDHAGTPESNVQGSPGSTCRDRTNGKHYTKTTGNGNTGWVVTGTQT